MTLTQPFASLVALGEKTIETRSWPAPPERHRGQPIAIHAAKGVAALGGEVGLRRLCETEPFSEALDRYAARPSMLPRGAIVATARIVACVPTESDQVHRWLIEAPKHEGAFGDYSTGRYAWKLADIDQSEMQIACRGALGLWEVPTEVEERIKQQAQRRA